MSLLKNENAENHSAQEDALMMETFLEECYRFRRNILSGKPEFVKLTASDDESKEKVKFQILEIIATDFPNIKYDRSTRVILGNTLKNLSYERREGHNGMLYYIVPKKAA